MVQHDVQVALGVGRKRLPEVLDQFTVKRADLCCRNRRVILKRIATTHINGRRHQTFVHGQREVPISANAGPVT
mgnify:CR=1 FL=1